jgi:hypothetical protein
MSPRRQPADPWPWPADSPLDRARRVATTYRQALETHAPGLCAQLDDKCRKLGQAWVLPTAVYEDDDLLTTELAADYLNVRPRTVDEYRRRGLPATSTPDGPRYRVADIRSWVTARRRNRKSTDTGGS